MFKVEIRKDCKICGKPLPTPRYRTFCNPKCRNKNYAQKYKDKNRALQHKYQDQKHSIPDTDKLQCLICGLWYVQVLTHVFQRHHITELEYKEEYDLPLKRGVIPRWYKELKGRIALENGTVQNLTGGQKYRFKKNDPKAKVITGWKGRAGSKGFTGY